jgi:large subunit ribosomal protein L18
MKSLRIKKERKERRRSRIRTKIYGTKERPRMSVYKSNKHMYIQVIDDSSGNTLASISTLNAEFNSLKNNREDGLKLGEAMAEKLKEQKVKQVVFDRNGNLFHGVVKSIADGVKKSGIKV